MEHNTVLLRELIGAKRAELQTGPFGTLLHASAYLNSGVPVVAVKNIGDNRLLYDGMPQISEHDAARLDRYRIRENDILFSRKGSVERRALIRKNEEGWLQGSDCIRLRFDDSIDPVFVSYYLGSPQARAWLVQHAHGATMPSLNQEILGLLPIPLPRIGEQHAVAHILGTLDDKIELNRQMNQTLAQIAAAIFKSWFVDFDPVRAKADGHQPVGMDAETAALFPDRLVESEMGEIPEGWQVLRFGDCFSLGLGGAWGEEEPSDRSTVAVHCLRGIDCHALAQRLKPTPPTRYLSQKQVRSRLLEPGVVLVEGSGSFCGRSAFWHEELSILFSFPVAYSNFCKRLNPTVHIAQGLVAWLHMRDAYDIGQLDGFRTGTAFPNFDVKGLLNGLQVVMPTKAIAETYLRVYEDLLRPDLILQSETLAEIRDALLPRLLSGEIRVPVDLDNENTSAMVSPDNDLLVQSAF